MTASNQSVVSATTPESLALKSTSLSMPVLELRSTDLDDVDQLLLAKVESAPAFFKRCPVVFNFNHLELDQTVDLKRLHAICLKHGFLPMGIQGEYEVYKEDLVDLGLANFAKGKVKSDKAAEVTQPAPEKSIEPVAEPVQQVLQSEVMAPEVVAPEVAEPEVVEPEVIEVIQEKLIPTKVVSSPIRSGQQIYAPGDLIILSSVSAGAEVLAVGNIHVYGALRGRALAGVKGDESVSVFCQKQEAELISIAGRFMIDEQLRSANWQSSVQACLKDDELIIKKLGE